MEIQAIKSQENKSDILALSGNILKINGNDFDLNNLLSPVQPTEENPEPDNTQFYLDNPCYIDAQGVEHLKQYVSQEDFFDYVNNNFQLFFDTDLNGDIDAIEFDNWIIHYNLPENGKRANRKVIKDGFSPEEWKLRIEACNPVR